MLYSRLYFGLHPLYDVVRTPSYVLCCTPLYYVVLNREGSVKPGANQPRRGVSYQSPLIGAFWPTVRLGEPQMPFPDTRSPAEVLGSLRTLYMYGVRSTEEGGLACIYTMDSVPTYEGTCSLGSAPYLIIILWVLNVAEVPTEYGDGTEFVVASNPDFRHRTMYYCTKPEGKPPQIVSS